jgi:golgi phosphoprotein 3
MQLNLYESFILLSLDKIKGKFLIDSLTLNYGLAGALLLQLSKDEIIRIDSKKLYLEKLNPTENKILNDCISLIRTSKKQRSAKYWVNKIGSKAGPVRNQILSQLCEKQILKVQKSKFLWIFTITRYPVINAEIVDQIKKELIDIVINFRKPDIESVLLLSLVNGCKLTRVFFPDKADYKKATTRIKELTKEIEIGEAVSQTIKEIQAAVIIASTSAVIAASAASTS